MRPLAHNFHNEKQSPCLPLFVADYYISDQRFSSYSMISGRFASEKSIPNFENLINRIMRKAMGKVATPEVTRDLAEIRKLAGQQG